MAFPLSDKAERRHWYERRSSPPKAIVCGDQHPIANTTMLIVLGTGTTERLRSIGVFRVLKGRIFR